MSASPWIPFPKSFPLFGTTVWVRMRDFTRRPFLAKWSQTDAAGVNAFNGYAYVADANNGTDAYIPWFELDAWYTPT